jgi:hypothetical protein
MREYIGEALYVDACNLCALEDVSRLSLDAGRGSSRHGKELGVCRERSSVGPQAFKLALSQSLLLARVCLSQQ